MPRFLALVFLVLRAAVAAEQPPVAVLSIDGAIGPATADYVHRGLIAANEMQAQLVVIRMDTPGGLDTAMRDIIKDILASPVPVATFVHPAGARAASAGTYILYASHIAAMTPATNLGAATPIAIGGLPGAPEPQRKPEEAGRKSDRGADGVKETEKDWMADASRRKAVFDAAAYIRGLAQLRGRNADWAEKAVREAVSLSAEEAAKIKVVDLLAQDVEDLLKQVDGRTVRLDGNQTQVLHTAGAPIVEIVPDWRNRFLATITNPSVAYVLMLIGIYGLLLEFYNPGFGVPGVAGAICLLLALYAFQMLPVNYVGMGLILLGIAFIVAEIFVTSYGVLGIGGTIAFVVGSVMLIDTDVPGFEIPWGLIAAVSVVSVSFLLIVVGMALKARKRPVVSGAEEMIGSVGEALEDFEREGWARVHSENWKVRAQAPVRRGQKLRVTAVDGLELKVTPVSEPDNEGG